MLAVAFFMPETIRHKVKRRIRFARAFDNIKAASHGQGKRRLFVTSFLFQSGFAFIITFFGVYLVSRFGFGQGDIGYIFAFVGLLLVFTAGRHHGAAFPRHAEPEAVVPFALFGMAASLIVIYFIHSEFWLYVLTVPAAVCAGLILTNPHGAHQHFRAGKGARQRARHQRERAWPSRRPSLPSSPAS